MYRCSHCRATVPKWSGKCPQCGEWNTLEEIADTPKKPGKIQSGKAQIPQKILEHADQSEDRMQSASLELDGVLGGGMIDGSLILLSGEPGIGKSTLALQMCDWYASRDHVRVLYVSGEESIAQISARARRLGITGDGIDLLSESEFESIIATIESSDARVVIIDSLSVLSASSLEGTIGSISQIRAMTEVSMHLAKKRNISLVLIGHVTKDGSISGPKSLEHLVDVVLYLEGVRTENYRLLRSLKNRFGPTDTVGIFRMQENGLQDLSDPGLEFIDTESTTLSGSALTMTVEGNRPLLIEIEGLTTYTKFGYPKRSARGVHAGKLDLMIAVMTKYTSTKLESSDVYLNVAHGITLSEPGCDLACIAALISSKKNIALGKTLFFGEVSLNGTIKNIAHLDKRLKEAEKLGFTRVILPKRYEGKIPPTLEVERISTLSELERIIT